VAEYIWAYVLMIQRAPLSWADRRECYGHLASWAASRAIPRTIRGEEDTASVSDAVVSVEAVVAGASGGA
jgi:hypothetical protein